METVSCAFFLLILYRVGGVMWRMSSGVDVRAEWMWIIYDEDIKFAFGKKNTYMCFCFVLI